MLKVKKNEIDEPFYEIYLKRVRSGEKIKVKSLSEVRRHRQKVLKKHDVEMKKIRRREIAAAEKGILYKKQYGFDVWLAMGGHLNHKKEGNE